MRVPWTRVLWWSCIVLPMIDGAVAGCGGRVIEYDCGASKQFCRQAVVCCPQASTCGTGSLDQGGNGCPLGDCCVSAPDASDEDATPEWEGDSFDASYGGGSLPGNGGGGGGGGGGGAQSGSGPRRMM